MGVKKKIDKNAVATLVSLISLYFLFLFPLKLCHVFFRFKEGRRDLRSIGSFDFVILGVFANEIGIRNRKKNKFFSFTEKEIYVIFSFFPQLQPNNYATLLNRN